MSFIVLLVFAWLLWKSKKIIWAAFIFFMALAAFFLWEVLLQAIPPLAIFIAILAAITGAWNFMKKHA